MLVAGSATLGIVTQALVLLWPLHRIGFRVRPRHDWRGAGLGHRRRVAGWTFAAQVIGQLGILVVTKVANRPTPVAARPSRQQRRQQRFLIFVLPHSLVTVSLLTAMFTRMAGHAAADDTAAVRTTWTRAAPHRRVHGDRRRVISVVALPMVRVLFPTASPPSAASLAPIIVALVARSSALGVWSLVQRVHYAYEDAGACSGSRSPWVAWSRSAPGRPVAFRARRGWRAPASRSRRRTRSARSGEASRSSAGSARSAARHARGGQAILLAGAVAVAVGWPLSRRFGDLSPMGFATALGVCVLVGLVMLGLYAAAAVRPGGHGADRPGGSGAPCRAP